MTTFASPPLAGAPPVRSSAANGISPSAAPISGSADTTFGSGTREHAMNPPSAPSNTSPASPSRGPLHKRTIARAKTTIAISAETISGQLDKLDPPTRIMALAELIRRFTKRIETEATIVFELMEVECESSPPKPKSKKRRPTPPA